jgi:hypothetical protein
MGFDSLTSIGIGERTNGFSRDFVDFLSGRSDRLSRHNFALTSEDYRSACYELDSLFEKVKDQLGEDIYAELHETITGIIGQTIFLSFKAGFSDGVKMIVHSLDD